MSIRKQIVNFIKKYRLFWAWTTLVLYIAAVPVTIFLFPANNLWLALLILFTGFTASLTTVADLLISSDEQ